MKKERYIVTVERPADVTVRQMIAHIRISVRSWAGVKEPRDPLFALNRQEISVVRETGLARRGMTLRQCYASKALQGMLSSPPEGIDRSGIDKDLWARIAFEFADAMIHAEGGAE